MPSLAASDLRAVLDVVYALNDDTGEAEMPGHVLAQLGSLVGCESLFYGRVEHTTGRMLGSVVEPAESDTDTSRLPGFAAVFGQHPGFAAYRCGRLALGTSAALTDLADLPTLRRLALYTDFHRPYGVNDQLLCVTHAGTQQGAVLAFNRARLGFSHRDRAVADLVAPHLVQAVARRQRLASLIAEVRRLGRHSEQLDQALPRLPALTAREREVVEHLLGGVTDREIARSLAISQRTVHKHLQRIYRKTGLGSRSSLLAMVYRANDANQRAVE